MIAARFRTIGWVAGVASAALCCYLVSQSVAAERAALVKVDRRIDDTRADIARLTTEIGTRGRMSQIDRWNAENFALQAPGARQFLASETQLASFGRPAPALPIDPDIAASKGAVEVAAFHPQPTPVVPVAPEAEPPRAATAPEQPMLRVASYVRPKADRLAQVEAAPVVKVAAVNVADVREAGGAPRSRAAAALAPAPVKTKPLSLLPDDIDSLAAAEKVKHKAPK